VAEHRLSGPVLGFAWDGTGYGTDGTAWGGEAIRCEGADFARVAQLRCFGLPGPDRAVRQPGRSALGILFEIFREQAADMAGRVAADWFTQSEFGILLTMLRRSINTPRTSSMGRLFDALAALCGLSAEISFEAQAAMEFEFAADPHHRDAYPMPLAGEAPAVADWEPLVRAVLADRRKGEPVARISARVHNALAEMAAAVARMAGCRQVVLSGGCFQNALLRERVRARLLAADYNVYTHHHVPPGDGGIALGQVMVAARQTREPIHVSGHSGQTA